MTLFVAMTLSWVYYAKLTKSVSYVGRRVSAGAKPDSVPTLWAAKGIYDFFNQFTWHV